MVNKNKITCLACLQNMNILKLLLSCFLLLMGCSSSAQPPLALPTPQQVLWHRLERTMFIHFAPNTWQGTELDNRSTPLSRINPQRLDVHQWIDAAEAFGAKMIVFVAKHAGGFCMWQTTTSEYSIKSTSYKNGKGDVLDELANACAQRGMRLGVYIYPGDDTWGAYIGGGGRTKDPAKQEAYNQVLRSQWEEVLSRYGRQIHEIWFDGSVIVPLEDIVQQYAPHAIVFQGPFASIRWVGNEEGIAPYPAWNSVPAKDAATGTATAQHGHPDGDVWMPLEVDVPLKNHNWFWSPTNHANLRSVDELLEIYYKSVGRGAVLLLNAAPDTTGLIPEEDMQVYRAFGRALQKRFSNPVFSAAGKGAVLEVQLASATPIDHIVIQEAIEFGERIREYQIEGLTDRGWQTLASGSSVGNKRIHSFDQVRVKALRLTSTKYAALPIIEKWEAFFANTPPIAATDAAKPHKRIGNLEVQPGGSFTIDLTAHIQQAGQYAISWVSAADEAITLQSCELFLEGVKTPGFAALQGANKCSINITGHPSGAPNSIQLRGSIKGSISPRVPVQLFLQKL